MRYPFKFYQMKKFLEILLVVLVVLLIYKNSPKTQKQSNYDNELRKTP